MKSLGCLCAVLSISSLNIIWAQFHPAVPIPFAKHKLDGGAYETAAVADVNKDGILDIIAGARWYQGPRWQPRFIRNITKWDIHFDSLSDIDFDVNQDGYTDILTWLLRGKTGFLVRKSEGRLGQRSLGRSIRSDPQAGTLNYFFLSTWSRRENPTHFSQTCYLTHQSSGSITTTKTGFRVGPDMTFHPMGTATAWDSETSMGMVGWM